MKNELEAEEPAPAVSLDSIVQDDSHEVCPPALRPSPISRSSSLFRGHEGPENAPTWKVASKAFGLLVFGVGLVSVFSDPMCDVLSELTNPSNTGDRGSHIPVPPFYVSFIVTPLCSNASELISSLVFASKKRRENISMTCAKRAAPRRSHTAG